MIRSENRLIWFIKTLFIRFMKHEQSEKMLSDQTLNISSTEGLSVQQMSAVCLSCQMLLLWRGDLSFAASSGHTVYLWRVWRELCLCRSKNRPSVRWWVSWVSAAWLHMCMSCITHSFHILQCIGVSHLCFNQNLQHQIASCWCKNTNQILYLSVYFSSVNKDSFNLS